ncbi:PAS domain-containing sensor histidine kinase [Crassaminicella indica]|uniref:PAS domain S-box protein n=1 Tax=Crassaminicella indica TaxID=2855394 RepID=A0ABX8RDT8_9CLOT|nr:PAS domain-containing sensor histidine kinase [Crassaminicella indica]QXM07244.1 PAS domain S-box protein [Crassaminicella indica]
MKSLKVKIPILIITLVLFAVIGSTYVTYRIASKQMRRHIINKNTIIANMISDQINQYLSDAKNTVKYVAQNTDVEDMERIKKEINQIYKSYRWLDVMFYMTPDGRITYSVPHNDVIYRRDYVKREYYKHLIKNKETYISKVFISSILNQPHIMIVSPILDEYTGEIRGIIGGGVPLEAIRKIVEKTQKSYDGKIYVVDGAGKVLVSPDHNEMFKEIVLKRNIEIENKVVELEEILKKYSQGVGQYQSDGHSVYVSFSKIENYKGMVMVERNEEYIGKEIKQIQYELIPLIFSIIAIAFFLSISLAYTITEPIEKLVEYVRNISKDIHEGMKGFKVTKNNEIGELELAFCRMSKELSIKIEDLKSSHKREKDTRKYLKNILRSAGSGIFVINDKEQVVIFNRAAEKITGIKNENIVGKYVSELLEGIKLPKAIFDKYSNIHGVIEEEYKIKRIDGVEVPITIMISPIYDDSDKSIGLVCLMKDLTQIKMLEQQLRREDRLKTIGELSSSIIHEIGNPLAGMTNLLEVLKDHVVDESLREELIDAIREEVDMLNNIVINFLEFTRMNNNKKVYINILHIIDSAINILKPEIKYKTIRVIKNFPRQIPFIKVDPSAMRQAFVNILKNSIQAVDMCGIIEIKVQIFEGILMVSIRDNGKGISEQKIDKIFNPFFTTKEDGTGLGLSIVHKIITDNGGTISVKSEVSKYTEFTLSFKGETDENINY